MRGAYLIVLALVGCSTLSEPPLPKQPDAPTSPAVVAALETAQDKVDGKVAAAVTVAKENADKPAVVDSELGVALSLLDKPSDSELALARQRSEKATPAEYEAARKFGTHLLASLDTAQAKLAADQKEAARISQLKDARIAALTADIVRIKQDASAKLWTATGCALAVLGALLCAFVNPKAGMSVGLCGAFCGSVPFIVGSAYFAWIAGATLVSVAALGIWHLYEVTNTPNEPPKV